MGNSHKIILYSFLSIIGSVSLISAVWLSVENRKIYQVYLEERQKWLKTNRELEYELDKLNEKMRKLKQKYDLAQIKLKEIEALRAEAEEKITILSQENQKLKVEVSRLVKERRQPPRLRSKNSSGDAFWSNILREKMNLELKLNSYERLIAKKNRELERMEEEKIKVNQALQEILEKKIELEQELESMKTTFNGLIKDIEQEKKEKLIYIKKVEEMQKEKALLESRIEIMEEEKKELAKKIQELKDKLKLAEQDKKKWAKRIAYVNQILEDKMIELDRLKLDLELAIKKIKTFSYVELPRIKVRANSLAEGKVIHVDPDNKFIIIDKGRKDGIIRGMKFLIYRNDNIVGKAEIEEVREATSAAHIILDLPDRKIAKEDVVKALPFGE